MAESPRAVLDANLIVRGLLTPFGGAGRLLGALARGRFVFVTSESIFGEPGVVPRLLYSMTVMAKPIQPTPPLEGEDAEDLLASLERHIPEDEARRRVDEARERLARGQLSWG